MGMLCQVLLTVALCWVCYKLGKKAAWNYIAENYIAIHKSTIVGSILIKNEGIIKEDKHAKKNNTRRTHKKTSK